MNSPAISRMIFKTHTMKRKLLLLLALIFGLLGNAQTTSIPDSNFESYLESHGMGNGINGDHLVTTANISSVTHLRVNELNISDLTGIEDFTSLTDFSCSNNNLTSITLPNVPGLANLFISGNNLTSLTFPDNLTYLLEFECSANKLTDIDFNNATYINYFVVDNNLLATLDLSKTDVEGISFVNNPLLTSIDLRNGAEYTEIYQFYGGNNPLLTCVFVDDVTYATANWTNIDANTNFVSDQAGCDAASAITTYVPDNNFEQALIDEGLDDVLDNYVLTNNINSIGFLDVSNKNIADLTGIEDFLELETFGCDNNQLTTLDLSNNHILEFGCNNNQLTSLLLNADARVVDCSNNLLTSLDVPSGIANLQCNDNNITSLDLSSTTELSRLNVSNNNLDFLDFRNGENGQISSSYDYRTGYEYSFDARNNPDLTCVFVDDATFSTTNWKKVDATSRFVNDQAGCDAASVQTTYIPDDNFEQILITAQLDDVLDNYVLTENIKNLTFLDVSNKDISDLTGIEDFTSLITLSCHDNSLTSLDVTQNTLLTYLSFSFNQIATIDVSKNVALEKLIGVHNQLTSLDVTKNINLQKIECWTNNIISVDLSQNKLLEELELNDNPLTSLDITNNVNLKEISFGGTSSRGNTISSIDVSKNTELTLLNFVYTRITDLDLSSHPNLKTLFVHHNQLTNIDVSQNSYLTDLVCYNNQLKTLNVKNGNNINFTRFRAYNNPFLNCVQVDDTVWSTTNWSGIDNWATFGGNCHYFETYVPDDNFEQALIDLNLDAGSLDDYVLTNNIKYVDSLNVSNKNIVDITGLEDFKSLTYLNCANNVLTELSLFENQYLATLICDHNQITALEFLNNTNLVQVYCNDNQLTRLEYLYYSLDLNYLECSNNKLTDLFIGNNPNLETLYTANNELPYLDVSGNLKLTKLDANQNQLAKLNVKNGNNINFTEFTAINNSKLTCIFVDDVTWSRANWTNIDATSNFVADEAACRSLAVADYDFKGFKILSNPVTEYIKLSIEEEANYDLIDLNGKVLKKGKLSIGYNSIKVSNMAKGLCFLRITNKRNSSVNKIIIK